MTTYLKPGDPRHDDTVWSEDHNRQPHTTLALIALAIVSLPYVFALSIVRHLGTAITVAVLAGMWLTTGLASAAATLALAVLALVITRCVNRELFAFMTARPSARWREWMTYRPRWRRVMRELYLDRDNGVISVRPVLLRVVPAGPGIDRLIVRPLYGQTTAVWSDLSGALAAAFGAESSSVHPGRAGTVRLDLAKAAVRPSDGLNRVPGGEVRPVMADFHSPARRARGKPVSSGRRQLGSRHVQH